MEIFLGLILQTRKKNKKTDGICARWTALFRTNLQAIRCEKLQTRQLITMQIFYRSNAVGATKCFVWNIELFLLINAQPQNWYE